jgi:hypothetical protein
MHLPKEPPKRGPKFWKLRSTQRKHAMQPLLKPLPNKYQRSRTQDMGLCYSQLSHLILKKHPSNHFQAFNALAM